jgi:hypothetical protein
VVCDAAALDPGQYTATITFTSSDVPKSHPTIAVELIVLPCVGDCDGSGDVTIDELITMVNSALGSAQSACPDGDADGNGTIEITEIIAAVNNTLNGCQ